MKNILITGAAGYIGTMLCTELVSKGYSVTAVDKLKYDKNYSKKTKEDRIKYVPKLFKPTIYYSQGVEIAYIPINSK